jgi:5-methyltetrahydrofolate--homocysteine methyltransferase
MNIFLEILKAHLSERLQHGGNTLETEVRRARDRFSAQEIYNQALIPAIKFLVQKYETNDVSLPELLKAAERAECLQQYLERSSYTHNTATQTGTLAADLEALRNADSLVLLASVKGDVHRVGINLADCLLRAHGYNTLNLGENQPIEGIVELLKKGEVTALAMTGLLNSSVDVMKENLIVLEAHGIDVPVLLGAPALTQHFVEQKCQAVYSGKVFYCGNALASLKAVETIQETKRAAEPLTRNSTQEIPAHATLQAPLPLPASTSIIHSEEKAPSVPPASSIPKTPFYGTRVVENISLQDRALAISPRQAKQGGT